MSISILLACTYFFRAFLDFSKKIINFAVGIEREHGGTP